jgi:hypothetical protein
MNILRAMDDPAVFGPWFRGKDSWGAWRVFLAGLFALPLEGEDLETFIRCTGRATLPEAPASEGWLVCGRRSGKSFMLSLIAVYLACFRDWRGHLAPGERATVMVVAADRRQARTIMRYIGGLLHGVPMLVRLIERETTEGYDLSNRVTIEVHACSFRAVRGYTVCSALLDEIAFWRSEDSANPDREVLEAIRPALATTPGSILLAASSPYARRGALWDAHRRYYAKDGPVLIWQTATTMMNPTVGEGVVEAALERDPSIGASEWLALFRSDIESYITREAVEACIEPGVRERPPVAGVRYAAFCDPSGGRADSMTLAIGHREQDCGVVDCIREIKPPFDPASVVREFSETLATYGVREVRADRYGGEWPTAEFRKHGIWCRPADKPKSDLYRELLPGINARRVELLDDPKLVAQLVGLERRVGRGGRDSIDHPPGMHDDVANATAGVWDMMMGKAAGSPLVQQRLLGV